MRAVIFDLDGTLADTSGDLLAAANACFRSLGYGDQLHPGQDDAVAVRGGRAMLTLGFERAGERNVQAAVDAQYAPFLAAYEEDIDRLTYLYPGAVEMLERLRSAGYGLGVCTNKPEHLADVLLTRLGVRDMFASLVGADTLPVRKPDPAPYHLAAKGAGAAVGGSVLVGDTITDRDTARAAGVPVALVTFGPAGGSVADLSPDALVAHFDEMHEIAQRLIG